MIARKTLLIVLFQAAGGILGFVALFFIAKFMGPEPLGVVAFALSFATMFQIVGKMGFDAAHVKRVSEGQDLGECIGAYSIIKVTLTILYVITIAVSLLAWVYILGRGFESEEHFLAIIVMTFYGAIGLVGMIMKTTFSARKEVAKYQISLFAGTFVRTIATVVVALSGGSALILAFTYIASEITVMAVAGYFFRNMPIKKPSAWLIKHYGTFALPTVLTTSMSIVMTNIDKVFIQLFWNSVEVGYYFAVYRIIYFFIMFSAGVGSLVFPTISKMHSQDKKDEIRDLVTKAERYMSLITMPFIFILIAFPKPIIHIVLSDSFYPAAGVMQVLPLWALLVVLNTPYGYVMTGMDRPWLNTVSATVRVVINVVLNLILIPLDIKILGISGFGLGAKGAAIATVVAAVFHYGYTRVIAWRLAGIKWQPKSVAIHILSSGVMIAVLYQITTIVEIERWYHLLGFVIIGLFVYAGVLYLVKELDKEDIEFFQDVINPIHILKYVKTEIKE